MAKKDDPKKTVRLGQSDYRVQEAAAQAAGLPWGAIAAETLARHFVDVASDLAAGGTLEQERVKAVRTRGDRPKVRITRVAAVYWGVPESEARKRIGDGKVLLRGKPIERSTIFEDEVEELEWT